MSIVDVVTTSSTSPIKTEMNAETVHLESSLRSM